MPAFLFTLSSWILTNFAAKVLLGAGVAIVSSAIVNTIITTYINKAINAASSVDPTYIGLLAISGLDQAISIVIGALVARATIVASSISLKKMS